MSKKYKNLFDAVISRKNIEDAYWKTQRGPLKYQGAALRFSRDMTENLEALQASLSQGSWRPGTYHQFTVYEPRERLIYAPCYPDKVVQHMVNNILKDIYLPCYSRDSYACIEGRGTHMAVNRISAFARQAKWRYGGGAYILKFDVQKFFYSINRDILKRLLRKKIADKRLLNVLDMIIDSSPGEKGLPLGNLTSQLFANIYLNELDQHIKRNLRVRYYVRYADDAVAFLRSKRDAVWLKAEISRYLENSLDLVAHPEKTKVFPVAQGVNTIGFKIHPTHRLLRDDSKRRVKRKLRKIPGMISSGKVTPDKSQQMLSSWMGHAKHGCSHNFIKTLLVRFPFLRRTKTRLLVNLKKEL